MHNDYVRALTRHLDSELSRFYRTDFIADADRDPTSGSTFIGYVSFMYDPWEAEEKTLLKAVPSPATYRLEATQVWGTEVKLVRVSGDADVVEFYIDDVLDSNIERLDALLDGSFGRTPEEAEERVVN